ncbi:MAG: type IX secretion system membrane protein PorP/SprF [Bacteroidota bacterium]|nr:type IX secretion system membrane protein PorP/SprF [Bacteroidota bacterium]
MKKTITVQLGLILCLLFSYQTKSEAQIAHYSQFYTTPMTIAPSFAGFTGHSRLSLNWRDQWPAISGTFLTYSVGFDHYFSRAKSGIGVLAFRDQAGSGNLALTETGVQYSYKLKIGQKRGNINNEWFLRPGIYFKYSQRTIDFHKLTFGDMILYDGQTVSNTSEAPPLPKKGYLDFAASLMGYTDLYWGGFTVDHLLRPDQSLTGIESKLPLKYSVYGGAKVLLKGKRNRIVRYGRTPESLTFAFHYRIQGKYDQLDIGTYWDHDPIVLGAWFRGIPIVDKVRGNYENIDAIIVLLGYKVSRSLKVGYSYDITVSNLLSNTGGSHEISLVYEFNKNLDDFRAKHTIIPCPSF